MSAPELKPCPFCGAGFKIAQEPQDNHPVAGMFYIFHDYGPLGSSARSCLLQVNRHFATKAEAIAAWNTRAHDKEGDDQIVRLEAEVSALKEPLRPTEADLELADALRGMKGFGGIPCEMTLELAAQHIERGRIHHVGDFGTAVELGFAKERIAAFEAALAKAGAQ